MSQGPRKALPRGGACLNCRRLKLKCTAEKPFCKHCVKTEKQCVYDGPSPSMTCPMSFSDPSLPGTSAAPYDPFGLYSSSSPATSATPLCSYVPPPSSTIPPSTSTLPAPSAIPGTPYPQPTQPLTFSPEDLPAPLPPTAGDWCTLPPPASTSSRSSSEASYATWPGSAPHSTFGWATTAPTSYGPTPESDGATVPTALWESSSWSAYEAVRQAQVSAPAQTPLLQQDYEFAPPGADELAVGQAQQAEWLGTFPTLPPDDGSIRMKEFEQGASAAPSLPDDQQYEWQALIEQFREAHGWYRE